MHRSTHWRHKRLRVTSDSDEEDGNRPFGIAMHNDNELSEALQNVDDFSHLDTHQENRNPRQIHFSASISEV